MPKQKTPPPDWIAIFPAESADIAKLAADQVRVNLGYRVRTARRNVKAFNTAAEVIVVAGWKVPNAR